MHSLPSLEETKLPGKVYFKWVEFFGRMCAQMLHNAHRGFEDKWLSEPMDLQMQTLKMSVAEFRTALIYGIDVEDKAVDVANWAAIILDHYRNGGQLTGE